MKLAVLVASLGLSASLVAAQPRSVPAPAASDKVAEAYAQFLLGHHLDETDQQDAALAAYKRAIELDPKAADIPAELAGLYLRLNKVQEAMAAAQQALAIAPANREANRIFFDMGFTLAEGPLLVVAVHVLPLRYCTPALAVPMVRLPSVAMASPVTRTLLGPSDDQVLPLS